LSQAKVIHRTSCNLDRQTFDSEQERHLTTNNHSR